MANNYSQGTVDPFLPAAAFSKEDRSNIEECGFSCEECLEGLYFFCEDGWEEGEGPKGFEQTFQRALSHPACVEAGITEIIFEGALYCDKMRPGEFGGFVCRITADKVQWGGTQTVIERMRNGTWE